MVADSRSSLRRPNLRGRKPSSSSSPPPDHAPPIPLQPVEAVKTLRSKRIRAPTVTGQEQEQKRRRLANKQDLPQLRIPLRSRVGVPKVVSPPAGTPSVSVPETPPRLSRFYDIVDSPGNKPQYDQIRIIEEKARASIHDAGATSGTHDDRRKLRSEGGGTRSKTELAQYFPDFEEMLSLNPPDPEALTPKTKVILVDDTPNFTPAAPQPDPFGSHKPLYKTEVIHLPAIPHSRQVASQDPLDDELYLKIHQKAERHEKQMKNGDREKAQHEKYQLERLLEELRGPDWLKILGITGVTETEKKRYEPKRVLFIRETQALIDKFKRWKEEEKRRKLEKEQALLEEAAENKGEGGDEGDDEGDEGGGGEGGSTVSGQDSESLRSASTQAPNSSEIDALASQQLIEEAKSASKRKKAVIATVPEPPVYKPFTSFFSKRHLRDAAVAGRQRGRTVLAFGQPVPELTEQDFELPDTILTEDAIRASQRHRRRLRRGIEE